jgi:cation diffusion facilitator family transporter
MSTKVRYARLSIASNSFLIVMKVIVGALTGSVSIVSEAIHSGVDLLAALIAYISVKISDTPPDEKHPFGHDKVENISGVVEAILIFCASGFIVIEAVKKIIHHEPVTKLGLAFAVMFVSSAVNYFVSKKLYKVAKSEESVALEADALHLKVDVYTSMGVGAGLLLMWLSGLIFGKTFTLIDPIVAILIALFILREAWEMLCKAFSPLIDESLSSEEIEIIKKTVAKYDHGFIDVHEVRTRRSGKMKHIDFHLTVPYDMTVRDAHNLCDRIEHDIEYRIRNTKVLIHTESGDVKQSQMKRKSVGAAKSSKTKTGSGRNNDKRKKTRK